VDRREQVDWEHPEWKTYTYKVGREDVVVLRCMMRICIMKSRVKELLDEV